jgi:kynurenine formamidase
MACSRVENRDKETAASAAAHDPTACGVPVRFSGAGAFRYLDGLAGEKTGVQMAADPIDLTHVLDEDTPVFVGDPSLVRHTLLSHGRDGCHLECISLGTHTGTHLDAPFHFFADGARVDGLPLSRLVGSGVRLDLSGRPEAGVICAAELRRAGPEVIPGDFVLVMTGWDRFWGTPRYFRHPYLAPDCGRWLVDSGAALVGLDTPSPDRSAGGRGDYPVHRLLLGGGVLIVENLRGLARVPTLRGNYAFLPLKLKGADGAPVRAVFLGA